MVSSTVVLPATVIRARVLGRLLFWKPSISGKSLIVLMLSFCSLTDMVKYSVIGNCVLPSSIFISWATPFRAYKLRKISKKYFINEFIKNINCFSRVKTTLKFRNTSSLPETAHTVKYRSINTHRCVLSGKVLIYYRLADDYATKSKHTKTNLV